MAHRALLGVLAILTVGGAGYGLLSDRRRGGEPGRSLLDDPASDASPSPDGTPPPLPTPANDALASAPRRPGSGPGAVVARIVRASDGAALAGVLGRFDGVATSGVDVVRRVWSDDRGDVRLDDVPAGVAYALRVQRDAVPPVDRRDIEVRAGETTDLGRIELESIGVVDALVLDVNREPIAGAVVSVSFLADAVLEMDATPWPLAPDVRGAFVRGTTDDRGRIRLEGVAPGPVAVRATSPNHRGRTFRAFVPAEPPKTAFVAFALGAGLSIVGRVVEADRGPLAGARVELGTDAVTGFDAKASMATGEDGAFAFRGCEPLAAFAVRATAAGFAVVTVAAASDAERTPPRRGTVAPDPPSLEIVLARSATLVVSVVDAASREPVGGARVRCTLAPLRADRRAARFRDWREELSSRETCEGRSDATGVAAIPIPAGRALELEIVDDTHRTLVRAGARGASTSGDAELIGDLGAVAEGERRVVTARLGAGLTLEGTVSDGTPSLPRVPIAGARVELWHGDRRASVSQSDAEGRYECRDALLPDRSPHLVVTAPGFYPATRSVASSPDVRMAKPVDVRLHRIEADLTVVGVLADIERRPVVGAFVRVADRDRSVFSGPDGTFRLERVPRRADPWVAEPLVVPLVAVKGTLEVRAAAPVPRPSVGAVVDFGTVTMDPVAEIRGVVLLARTRDRARFPLVELVDLETGEVLDALVGGEFGDFTFVARAAGAYRVRASDAGRGGGRDVTVAGGRQLPSFLEVRMVEATVCAGRVEDRAGRPIAGLAVKLDCQPAPDGYGDESLSETSTLTDSAGVFRFRCFGARPQAIHGERFDRSGRPRAWNESVRARDDNVVRLSDP